MKLREEIFDFVAERCENFDSIKTIIIILSDLVSILTVFYYIKLLHKSFKDFKYFIKELSNMLFEERCIEIYKEAMEKEL